MRAHEIMVLMASAAMHGCCAIALRPSPDIHDVLMQVVSLARIIAS
jgi:hypothetical protein